MPPYARTLYLQGIQALSEERWADARAAFAGALELYHHNTVLGDLGSAELRLGEHRSAAQHLATYVRLLDQDSAAFPEQRAQGRAELDHAKAKVGTVMVRVDVDGARITGDHELLGVTPLVDPLFVEPGHRVFIVAHRGCPTRVFKIHIAAGEQTSLDVALCKRNADTTLRTAQTPGASKPSPATATSSRRDGDGYTQPDARRSWVPVVVLGAASAVGLGLGVGLTVAANNASDDAHEQRATILHAGVQCLKPSASWLDACEQVRAEASRADTLGNAARVTFIAAGVLAIAAGVLAPGPKPKSTSQFRFAPVMDSQSTGAVLQGVW